ncbi:MAG: dihydroneopterin aldolase [Saprospiraceae bacterium]|nr:dihydroneopterin aldolase [Saprospiraceae bacterium]MCZ2337352.1 dihydroneopterin aldolase [Chitinophagales bacterium]
MKTRIAIEGAAFFAHHGYYEEEQRAGNHFIIDAEVTMDHHHAASDEIHHTVNYEAIYQICKQEMQQTHKLLETVVFNILTRFKSEFYAISSAKVRLTKLGPQLGGPVEKSVVEMEF